MTKKEDKIFIDLLSFLGAEVLKSNLQLINIQLIIERRLLIK